MQQRNHALKREKMKPGNWATSRNQLLSNRWISITSTQTIVKKLRGSLISRDGPATVLQY